MVEIFGAGIKIEFRCCDGAFGGAIWIGFQNRVWKQCEEVGSSISMGNLGRHENG